MKSEQESPKERAGSWSQGLGFHPLAMVMFTGNFGGQNVKVFPLSSNSLSLSVSVSLSPLSLIFVLSEENTDVSDVGISSLPLSG